MPQSDFGILPKGGCRWGPKWEFGPLAERISPAWAAISGTAVDETWTDRSSANRNVAGRSLVSEVFLDLQGLVADSPGLALRLIWAHLAARRGQFVLAEGPAAEIEVGAARKAQPQH